MEVLQLWTGNALRNFNYVVACSETGEAMVLDPFDADLCVDAAREKGWTVTQIFNTHVHFDHIRGNPDVRKATGATLLVPKGSRIPDASVELQDGDTVRIGTTIELKCLDTPGHTMIHLCLFADTDEPVLFAGDTLFNAGVGNTRNGGDPDHLYATCSGPLAELPDGTRLYPGHDYLESNLQFTLDREPDNAAARALLEVPHDPSSAVVTTLGLEKQINTFLRLRSPTLLDGLREKFPDLAAGLDDKTAFIKLRELRDGW